MSNLSVFNFNTHPVRTIDRDNQIWFVAADILVTLKLNRSSLQSLDDDEKGVHTMYTLKGEQEMTTINESGLYSLVLRSRKAEAKVFKKWVTSEVLPSIRRTGSYSAPQARPPSSDHLLLHKLFDRLKAERNAAVRGVLVQQVGQLCQHLGLQQPNYDAIGHLPPPVDQYVQAFFDGIYALMATGVAVNHSRKPLQVLAINLAHVRKLYSAAGIQLDTDLGELLKQAPGFIEANRSVNSAITGRIERCYIFKARELATLSTSTH